MTNMERTEELMFNLTKSLEDLFGHLCSLSSVMDNIGKKDSLEKIIPSKKNSTSEKNSSEMEKIRQKWMDNVVGVASEFFINEESFNLENLSVLLECTVNAMVDMVEPESSVNQTFSGGHVHAIHKKEGTILDKFREEHPELKNEIDEDIIDRYCPGDFGYVCPVPEDMTCKEAKMTCERCWKSEFTAYTCRERLQREHPNKIDIMYCGGCQGCPTDYGYIPEEKILCYGNNPHHVHPEVMCAACWGQPAKPKSV